MNYYEKRMTSLRPVSEQHGNYKGITQSYAVVHYRLRFARGRAADQACVDCEGQAREWSLTHDAVGRRQLVGVPAGEARKEGTWVSDNPMDYEPRCIRCHRSYDGNPVGAAA